MTDGSATCGQFCNYVLRSIFPVRPRESETLVLVRAFLIKLSALIKIFVN